ncbi:MAG TPA: hypothetical protein VE223_07130 [Nitrososphaeraceae archaeon]|jgi:hypothetical protein|nr:hypothetical protein [Nitrososphaeraceae archaeon]
MKKPKNIITGRVDRSVLNTMLTFEISKVAKSGFVIELEGN